jgi:hypothetical protein
MFVFGFYHTSLNIRHTASQIINPPTRYEPHIQLIKNSITPPGKQKSVLPSTPDPQIRRINKQITRHFRALCPMFALTQATKVAVDRRYNSQLLFKLIRHNEPLRPRAQQRPHRR